MDDESMPAAHPAFARHFTDSVYDEGGEFAPFETDEGWDLLYEWSERRDELDGSVTLEALLEESDFDGVFDDLANPRWRDRIPIPGGPIDAATIVIGGAFTLLRLGGHIDEHDRQQALRALDLLIKRFGQGARVGSRADRPGIADERGLVAFRTARTSVARPTTPG